MTKSELIDKLALRYPDMERGALQAILDLMLNEMSNALVKKGRVELRGFGVFSVRLRRARIARNPKTKVSVDIDQRYSSHFKAGKDLKDLINS